MSQTLKVGFFADGPWAHGALELLLKDPSISICFICARSDNPDQHLYRRSQELGIDFVVETDVNCDRAIKIFKAYEVDLFVSMSFNQIFRKRLYRLPRYRTINCHAGKLPLYRGRNILNWAIINDEKEFGITVHYVDEGVDTGDIVLQKTYPICDHDDYQSLLKVAYSECPKILHQAICLIRDNKVVLKKQASLLIKPLICTRRLPGDEVIDWNQSSREIFCFVRALVSPGPFAQTTFDEHPVAVRRVELIAEAPVYKGIPGALLAKDGDGFIVKTADSYIKIVEWTSSIPLRAGGRFQ